jgi:cobalamin biosynthesis protein CbiG
VSATNGTAGPRSELVIGVGLASAATADELAGLVERCLALAGAGPDRVRCVATIDRWAQDERVTSLGWPVVGFPAAALADVPGVRGSAGVHAVVGTASVAEAAALLAAGTGSRLVVAKERTAHATGAVSRAVSRSVSRTGGDVGHSGEDAR